jgi:hypothetical protein
MFRALSCRTCHEVGGEPSDARWSGAGYKELDRSGSVWILLEL